MPDIKTDDGCVIHVEVEGPQNGPVLMLSNSLGTNLHSLRVGEKTLQNQWSSRFPALLFAAAIFPCASQRHTRPQRNDTVRSHAGARIVTVAVFDR